jgi:hypothetical protein
MWNTVSFLFFFWLLLIHLQIYIFMDWYVGTPWSRWDGAFGPWQNVFYSVRVHGLCWERMGQDLMSTRALASEGKIWILGSTLPLHFAVWPLTSPSSLAFSFPIWKVNRLTSVVTRLSFQISHPRLFWLPLFVVFSHDLDLEGSQPDWVLALILSFVDVLSALFWDMLSCTSDFVSSLLQGQLSH